MRSINVSEPVWQAIADRGKFGETEDDVLRRVFDLPENTETDKDVLATQQRAASSSKSIGPRRSFATDKLSSYISDNKLRVSFASGPSSSWTLPERDDKANIRIVRDKAVSFAEDHGATLGQVNAVKKTLTDSGYHLIK